MSGLSVTGSVWRYVPARDRSHGTRIVTIPAKLEWVLVPSTISPFGQEVAEGRYRRGFQPTTTLWKNRASAGENLVRCAFIPGTLTISLTFPMHKEHLAAPLCSRQLVGDECQADPVMALVIHKEADGATGHRFEDGR